MSKKPIDLPIIMTDVFRGIILVVKESDKISVTSHVQSITSGMFVQFGCYTNAKPIHNPCYIYVMFGVCEAADVRSLNLIGTNTPTGVHIYGTNYRRCAQRSNQQLGTVMVL